MAEAVMRDLVERAGLSSKIRVDSAGTGNWHEGESADPRTQQILKKYSHSLPSRARQVRRSDFTEFDYIVALDQSHLFALTRWNGAQPQTLSLLLDWAGEKGAEVPDPYYGDLSDFETVYELVQRGCEGLLAALKPLTLQSHS